MFYPFALLLAVSVGVVPAQSPCVTPTRASAAAITISPEQLRPYVDQEAAEFLELVTENPGRLEPRRELAAHYRATGRYVRLAELFELTSQFVEKGTEGTSRIAETAPSINCQIRIRGSREQLKELYQQVTAAQQHVAAEVHKDQYGAGAGLAAAEAAIRMHGAFCPLLAEWASAYLWRTALHRDWSDPVRRELAIRLLVTLADENEYPVGSEGSASVYYVVSQMLSARNDYVGAYAAVLVAHDRLRLGSVTGSIDETSFGGMLAEAMAELRPLAREQRSPAR